MEKSARQSFLEIFLRALGADEIEWKEHSDASVSGTVVYRDTDPEEYQDFKWHMIEKDAPDDQVCKLVEYLNDNNLIDGDKIIKPAEEINFPEYESEKKARLFSILFDVKVMMVDDGVETDYYFLHE